MRRAARHDQPAMLDLLNAGDPPAAGVERRLDGPRVAGPGGAPTNALSDPRVGGARRPATP